MVSSQQIKTERKDHKYPEKQPHHRTPLIPKEEEESDTEALQDVFPLGGDLLDTELVNTLMNEDINESDKNAADSLEGLAGKTALII